MRYIQTHTSRILVSVFIAAAVLLSAALSGTAVRADNSTTDTAITIDYPVSALRGLTCTGFIRAEFRGIAWKASAGSFAIVSIDSDVTEQNTAGSVTVATDATCLATADPHLLDIVSATAKSQGFRYLEGLTIGTDSFGSAVGPI